jgi:quercetin dioxygenase-like cupin family protein
MPDQYVICDLRHWVENHPFEEYLQTAKKRPLGLAKNPYFRPLLAEMRALVPVPGKTWVKDIDVTIEPGQTNHQGQVEHSHPEWTAVFYVNPADVPIIVGGECVTPQPGELIVMAPGVSHHVADNQTDQVRLSFAMLVEDPGIPSKFTTVGGNYGDR